MNYWHLHQIDEECNQMMDRLVEQMKEKQGVTEELKMQNQIDVYKRQERGKSNPSDFSVVHRGRIWRIEDCEYAQ